MFKRFVSLNLCSSTRQFARAYTIPRSTAQRIALKGSTKQPTESKMISIGTSYVFSPAMLATWAACCMAFGVSISLFGVDQGWINFVGGNKPNKSELLSQDSEDEDTLSVDEEYAAITARLMSTEAAKECLENTQEWKRLPYFWNTRDKSYESAFIPSTLHAPDKMSVEPVVFLNRDRQQFVFIIHIGKRLCGHDGIVHGGVQATLFDEVTARPAFWNLPRNVALTASLKVNYRRPVVADQILVFKSQLSKLEGRKATVTAQLEDLNGNLLSDAEALYVSPGNEKLFPDNSSRIKAFEDTYPGSF